MAGDHKCSVCSATFTRPQHVARHMRSHTGDRPYRCQYCGDQFARSDLLSRHVNKCHANEKPLPAAGARRKGSASASRATTSKQACDYCVEHSLPCDGCNPCAQCLKRKQRCTFVKFHRQTAPTGPGHEPPGLIQNSSSSSSSISAISTSTSSSSRFYTSPHDDNFLIDAIPPSLQSMHTVPSQHHIPSTMGEALYASDSFSFQPLYPQQSSASPVLTMPHDTPDFTSRFRENAEVLRREQAQAQQQGLYAAPQMAPPQTSRTPPLWGWDPSQQQQQQHPRSSSVTGYNDRNVVNEKNPAALPPLLPLSAYMPQSTQTAHLRNTNTTTNSYQNFSSLRRQSLDPFVLQGMTDIAQGQGQGFPSSYQHHQPTAISTTSSSQQSSEEDQPPPSANSVSAFHAAFGQLSLDDLDLPNGSAPFFSTNPPLDDPNHTPMQLSLSALMQFPSSSGKDNTPTEALWRQFINTPSSLGPASGPQGYRRQRVASLPSPSVMDRLPPYGQHQGVAISGQGRRGQGTGTGIGLGQVGTVPQEYKLAVLDRAPMMNLRLGPKARRGTAPAASTALPASTTTISAITASKGGDNPSLLQAQSISRPGSASSTSSSLANVYRRTNPNGALGNSSSGSGSASPQTDPRGSREGSVVSVSTSDGGENMRPAFKRGPSHILEPGSTKRALVVKEDEGPVVRVDVTVGVAGGGHGHGQGRGGGEKRGVALGEGREDERKMVTLAERRRRMSVPGGVGDGLGRSQYNLELGALPPV